MRTEPSHQDLKAELRKAMRQRMAALTGSDRPALDEAIRRHLLDWVAVNKPGVVAAFLAFDGEPDLQPALLEMARQGVRLALPVILDEPGRAAITLRAWAPGHRLKPNRFGILEPEASDRIRLSDIDLVLLPLVAWDELGGRLGMGASFYDRLLQPVSELPRPLRVGVGYQVQRAERLPIDPWDVRLHMMISETGCHACGSGVPPPAALPTST
jgi:5-formyltetrahydrofolate cyclo-ligase